MKKIFLFLSILMFALTGIFFACEADRYADLKITYNMKYYGSEKQITKNKGENFYRVNWGEKFIVDAKVSCSSDISTALNFTAVNGDSINAIGSPSNTSNGSKQVFEAVAPSYDEMLAIKVESVETGRNAAYIFIKVVLPVEGIDLADNLGMTYGAPVNLIASDAMTFIDASNVYETNEKGVNFKLNTYTDLENNTYTLETRENGDYYFVSGEQEIDAFRIENNNLVVLKKDLEGLVNVTAESEKFQNKILPEGTEDQKLINEYIADQRLTDTEDIAIVKPVVLEDISFIGGQVVFKDYDTNGTKDSKLTASLYLNSLDSYTINSKQYYYNYEDVNFTVYTSANVNIYATVGNMIVGEEEFASDVNVVKVAEPGTLTLNKIYGPLSNVVGYETTIKVSANGGSGFAYVDFVVEYTDFSNKLEYSFSKLYAEYLQSLSNDEYAALSEDAKKTKVVFESTALPAEIILEQDDRKLNELENIKIYDSYGTYDGFSSFGTKIDVKLALSSGTMSSKIKDENKIVKVYVYDSSNNDPTAYFDIYDSLKNRIILSKETVESVDYYYFELDLSKAIDTYFFVKAAEGVINQNFTFKFENILASKITSFNNEQIEPNTDYTTLKNLNSIIYVETVKGIEDVLVVTPIEGEENPFPAIDSKNLDAESEYGKLVLRANDGSTFNKNQGTLIAYMVNKYVIDPVSISVDEEYLEIFTLDTATYASFFEEAYNAEKLDFKGALSIVGKKVGTTQIVFSAENGFKVFVEVEIVNAFTSAKIDLKQGNGKDIISQNKLNIYGEDPYASAKINGSFNIVYTIAPDASGVFNVDYKSSNADVITINKATGLVNTVSKGITVVTIEFSYYKFDIVGDFYQWTTAVEEKSFTLEVYIPATTIKLNKSVVNVYDYESLGYEYKDQSTVAINVIVYPVNANIANDNSNVTFYLSNNNNNLIGKNGIYTAFLNPNQEKATVYVTVSVFEYGKTAILNCVVNIYKAPQVEQINFSVFEGSTQRKVSEAPLDSQGHAVFSLSTQNDKTLTFNTSIIPSERNVLVDDLVVVVFKANQEDRELTEIDSTKDYASINHKSLINQNSVIINGQDSFNLKIGTTYSGYFYVVIFARDNMDNATSGELFVKILIQITDGTQANPYVIETVNQLIDINTSPTKHYVLGANLNLSSISNWTPIKNFTGSLNGFNPIIGLQGTFFEIAGLKINTVQSENVGLFETISNSSLTLGAVMNLTLKVSSINLINYAVPNSVSSLDVNIGTIAGKNEGVIVNCAVEINSFRVALTNKNANVGGIVGVNGSGEGGIGGGIFNFSNNSKNATVDFNLDLGDTSNNIMIMKTNIPQGDNVSYLSANPVNGKIIIADKAPVYGYLENIEEEGLLVNAGGIAGVNFCGYINGIYGIYNLVDEVANASAETGESNVSYLTNYQSQGIDVSIDINYGTMSEIGNVANPDTAIGGVVGLLKGGKISNVSAEGHIGMYAFDTNTLKGAYNNVGGIAGKTAIIGDSIPTIENISTSLKLRANDNVGGVVGYAERAIVNLARVEAYENTKSNDQTLIVGSEYVGGIIGYALSSDVTKSYSFSFVDDFNAGYIAYGDIYSIKDWASVGGIIGQAVTMEGEKNVAVTSSYSTLNIVATGVDAYVGGIIGSIVENDIPILTDIAYVGVIINNNVSEEGAASNTAFAYNVSNTGEPVVANPVISGYYYYYILGYADKDDIENGPNKNCLYVKDAYPASSDVPTTSSFYNSLQLLTVTVYEDSGEGFEEKELKLKVPTYTRKTLTSDYTCYLIRLIPSEISVSANGQNVIKDDENNSLILKFKDAEYNKNYYYTYVDNSGVQNIIINYAEIKNEFALSELFTVVPTPVVKGNLNILVSSSDNNNLQITDVGNLVIKRTGNYELTFVVKENVSATAIVKVLVIKNFDELLISNLPTYKSSLFDHDEENAYKVRIKNEVNVFNLFAEYVSNAGDKVVYETVGENKLVAISNVNNYAIEYIVDFKGPENASFVPAADDQYDITSTAIKFAVVGNYRVTLKVTFVLNGINYVIENDAWKFYFNAYSGATNITFSADEIWLQGNEIYNTLQINLTSDVGDFEDLYLIVSDNVNKLEYEYTYIKGEGTSLITYDVSKEERESIDGAIYPFEISVAEVLKQEDIYHYNVTVSITNEFKGVETVRNYILKAYDGDSKLVNKPAVLDLHIAPQGLNGLTTIHYAYTQQVSQLTNIANTEANTPEEEKNTNYSYSFSGEPKNTVVAGNEGLFVIDLYPFYANITSISIESSLGAESGHSLQFVQLVKIKGNSGYYYIYAPLTQSTGNNGIYLNKYSYVPEDVATISYESDLTSKIVYSEANVDKKLSYGFVEETDENQMSSEIARLYVKTIAPTNLKEEEELKVIVKIKYKVVNEEGILVEKEYLVNSETGEPKPYEHKLVVESMPGFSMRVTHDGADRDVIAYTGTGTSNAAPADWLEIVPIVEEGYTYDKITASWRRDKGDPSSSTDYVELRPNNVLILGSKARPGDKITISVIVKINYEGYTESRIYSKEITVVDVVIEEVTIKDLDADNNLKITVSTSRQLKAEIIGFGIEEAISEAENAISRSVSYEDNLNYFWQARSKKSGEQYVNLESVSLRDSLPFVVNKVSISNDITESTVSSEFIGAGISEVEKTYKSLSKIMVVEGSTDSGSVDMRLALSFVYNPDGGKITFVPNTFDTYYKVEKYFQVVVTEDSNEDNPTPIYDEAGLKAMASANIGSYILMNDITIDRHTALTANFSSFDGNNKIITINSFEYSTDIIGTQGDHSINLGLFNTVSEDTIIKNVIVAYPANKAEPMNLRGYSTINFGGIAAINNGVITNCDVISVLSNENVALTEYVKDATYTLNIQTETLIGGKAVQANIGGLVAINGAQSAEKAFITNSRVGRESVEILTVYDSEATVVYKNLYRKTAPITVIKVQGSANVAGFVAVNNGTISTSYAKNIQLEAVSNATSYDIKTAGFVVTNKGFVYGSYSAGWEEEDATTDDYLDEISANRKLGGGLFTNGFIGGFVYENQSYIEDCYSNINVSGDLIFAADTSYIELLKVSNPEYEWPANAAGGFVYKSTEGSYITTSYSMSKIHSGRLNTHGAFEGRDNAPDDTFTNDGTIENCYFMLEKVEDFNYDHERARMLSDDPVIDLEGEESVAGTNEFINKSSFNNFSFDNSITDFNGYNGESTGGVWAIYKQVGGTNGYPELISANTIAISCRVINVTKTNESDTNQFYYTYVDGYDIGSYLNPYIISNFTQYNNIFKDAIGSDVSLNENIPTKFTGNIRLIKNIDFAASPKVYSTSIEYTSLINLTSIFDGNYLAMYNINLLDEASVNKKSFGLFRDIYYAAVKNVTLAFTNVDARETVAVGGLAGSIVNSNISNVTLIASTEETQVLGKNYVGALAGIVVSNDERNTYTVSNIKSNLKVVVGGSSSSDSPSAITTSFFIWEKIKPISSASGLSEINSNLRLHKLPEDYYYGGGVIGFADLHQVKENINDLELKSPNIYNVHVGKFIPNTILSESDVNYDRIVSVQADFAGGLFGFVGAQTFVECAEFLAIEENDQHYIAAKQIAGGIAAVNFGKLSQCYVSFDKETVLDLNDNIVEYVNQEEAVQTSFNKTLFYLENYNPKYIGGIAGINVGNGTSLGAGNIVDCYNRVDVRNPYAKGVGGIVGGTYIGQISNVYTTASLMGDLKDEETKIGGIIGKIFENGNEGYFADYYGNGSDYEIISLFNIVALNIWNVEDFDALYEFVNSNGGYVGALYGKYTNEVSEGVLEEDGLIRITGFIFVQNYAVRDYTDPDISTFESDDVFDISCLEDGTYFELWGVHEEGSPNHDPYLNSHLCEGANKESLIFPNDFRALMSGTEFGVSTLREVYFPSSKWSRVIWNYDDVNLLPILEYGYESSVIRIYTANQFIEKLKEGNSSGKLYVIMNDIDFDGVKIDPIATTFRGQLYGNNVTFDGFTRKPILFNVDIGSDKDEMTTGIFAILQNSIGATYSNFNIVLRNYNVTFSDNLESETVASVLIGSATNSTINNVNIYSSLNDYVNRENMLDYKFGDGTYITSGEIKTEKKFIATQGYYIDGVNKEISSFYGQTINGQEVNGYIKLATLLSTDARTTEEGGFSNQYIFTYNGSTGKYEIVSKYDGKEGKYIPKAELTAEEIELAKPLTVSKAKTKILKTTTEVDGILTNGSTVGLFIGAGSLSYVSNSSANVEINVRYTKQSSTANGIKYVGSLVGRNIGEMRYVISTSTINVTRAYEEDPSKPDIDELYVGAIVGNIQGVIRFAYVKNNAITVGTSDKPIVARSGANGTFVGGVVGSIDRYTTVNEAIVGGANFLYVTDCDIDAFVKGKSSVAGVIGQNSFTVGDLYVKQSPNALGANKQKSITITVNDPNSNPTVAGLVAINKSTFISNSYNNSSIYAVLGKYNTISMGGIIGIADSDAEINNVISDAKEIKVTRNTSQSGGMLGTVHIGGVLGQASGIGATVVLNNIFSTVNIISEQENIMNIGGVIGTCTNLVVSNVAVLGNITLNRGKGDGTEIKGVTNKATYYYAQTHNIGGLVGDCSLSYSQDIESTGTIVLSTIRDYAIAQKLNVNIGPVIGTNNKMVTTKSKTYFCEAIALVADNGYNEFFVNIDQTKLLTNKDNNFDNIYKNAIFKNTTFVVDSSTNVYSNYYTNYYNIKAEKPAYISGSKLSPKNYNGTLEANNHYVLTSDLTTALVSNGDNWILNGQGNTVKVNGAVINTVTEGSALVGVLTSGNKTASGGALVKENKGFVFACGSSGKITASGVSGLVQNNNGVINSCFSIANISVVSGSGAGLVLTNGSSDYVGNIYSSYYTGTITPVATDAIIAGIATLSVNGVISNSYTMGDLDVTESKFSSVQTYPVTNSNGLYNVYNSYYDYLCYAGNGNEGITKNQAETLAITTLDAKDFGLISEKGIYVWSSTLAGDEGGLNYVSVENLLKGSWLRPGDEQSLIALFAKSEAGSKYNVKDIKLDTSWFNYGYTTNNLTNIIVNTEDDDDFENVIAYLQMLYTGNGLEDVENVGKANPKLSYNTFVDQPYRIKHAGMLDILVRSNNAGEIQFKYYLFVKNIDFVKYSGTTYWSESWDRNLTVFVGDLNGKQYDFDQKKYTTTIFKVMNMYSSYGLLRVLPNIDTIDKTTKVRNLIFEDSFSKTGLVAGYQHTGSIENIQFGKTSSNYVVNGDYSGLISKTGVSLNSAKYDNASFNEATIKSIMFKTSDTSTPFISFGDAKFAGGVVGFMQGGVIDKSNTFTNLYVTAVDTASTNSSYVGGMVGIMQGGSIAGESASKPWGITGINAFASLKGTNVGAQSYVGAIAGYTGVAASGKASISFLAVQTQTTGYYGVAGVAGVVEGASISDCSYQGSFSIGYRYVHNKGFTESAEVSTDKVVIGGIASYLTDSGSITNSKWEAYSNTSVSVPISFVAEGSNYAAVGGIVGEMDDGDISASSFVTDISVSSNNADTRVGGIAGYMMSGRIKGKTTASGTIKVDSLKYAVAGGIVGYMINGSISGTISSSASVDGVDAAGGIVGEITAYDDTEITITASATSGLIQTSTATSKAGGIVGYISCLANSVSDGNLVTLSGCTTGSSVTAGSSNALYAGGIVGAIFSKNNKNDNILVTGATNEATVKTQTYATANATDKGVVSGASFAGGIVGYIKYARIESSKSKGNVGTDASASPFIAGGIVGYSEVGVVKACSTTGGTVSAQRIAGGIIGFSHGVLVEGNISSSATVSNMTPGGIAGGIFGVMATSTNIANAGSISNTGNVGSSNSFIAGGVVGYYKTNTSKIIKNVTNSGSVTSSQGSFAKLIDITSTYNAEKNVFNLQSNTSIFDATPGDAAGGIIGYAGGSLTVYDVETSSTTGAITGYTNAGGIIGSTDDLSIRITNVTNVKNVTANKYAGGIIGKTPSSIKFVTKLGEGEENPDGITFNKILNGTTSISPTITSSEVAGGIAGLVSGVGQFGHSDETTQTIINYGSIGNANTVYAGGLIGTLTSGNIYSGKNVGAVLSNKYAGGLIGNLTGGNIYESCAVDMGSNSITANEYAGGVVGYAESGVTYVNVTSAKFGSSKYVGGLVGYLSSSAKAVGKVSCNVSGGTQATGGAIGYLDGGNLQDVTRGKDAAGNDIVFKIDASGITVTSTQYAGGVVGYMNAGNIAGGKGGNPAGTTASGGIVGYVTNGGIISGGTGGNATSSSSTSNGGAVGKMDNGSITKDTVQGGNAKNGTHNGGLVGLLITGNISKGKGGEASGGTNAGGLVGLMQGGSISGGIGGKTSGASNAGGLVGKNEGGQITSGSASGGVTGSSSVGGIVGYMTDGSVGGGTNSGSVSGGSSGNGGVVGCLTGGTVSGGYSSTVSNGYAGGVVGYMTGGTVSGGGADSVSGGTVGGSVGYLSSGNVSGGGATTVSGTTAGGVVGLMEGGSVSGGWSSSVSGTTRAGGTVGYLKNGSVSGGGVGGGSVSGGTVGGVIGLMDGGSVSAGNVSASVSGTVAGGIVGQTSSQLGIGFSQFSGTVKANSSANGGGILGKGSATLSGGTMSGTVETGCGVVGTLSGTLYLSGNLSISGTIPSDVGVITTTNTQSIGTESSVTVSVTKAKKPLVVTNSGTIKGITVSGTFEVDSTSDTNFGTIAATNSGSIDNCSNGVSFTCSATNVGGICGSNSGTIYDCTNTVNITASKKNCRVGGIVGVNTGNVGGSGCSNTGNITYSGGSQTAAGTVLFEKTSNDLGAYVGGIAGYASSGTTEGSSSGIIKNNVKYESSDTSATITDNRGNIAGRAGAAAIVNSFDHSEYATDDSREWQKANDYTLLFMQRNRDHVDDLSYYRYVVVTGNVVNFSQAAADGYWGDGTSMSSSTVESGFISEFKSKTTGDDNTYWGIYLSDTSAIIKTAEKYAKSKLSTNVKFSGPFYAQINDCLGFLSIQFSNIILQFDTVVRTGDIVTATPKLQDCGGEVTHSDSSEEEERGHRVKAVELLYDICKDHGCTGGAKVSSTASSVSSNGQGPSSGSAGTPSGESSGGGAGGTPGSGLEFDNIVGDLSGIQLSSTMKGYADKCKAGPYDDVVYAALAFASKGTDAISYHRQEHYYSDSFSGDPRYTDKVYYNYTNAINCIVNDITIRTDCFGYVRLCYCAAGFNYFWGYTGSYSNITTRCTDLSQIHAGAVLRSKHVGGEKDGQNRHVALFLYADGTDCWYIDQSLVVVKAKITSRGIEGGGYVFQYYQHPPTSKR